MFESEEKNFDGVGVVAGDAPLAIHRGTKYTYGKGNAGHIMHVWTQEQRTHVGY
jgi:hypothetical protein